MYHLYILRCSDGTFYTGITTDLARRLAEHNFFKRGAKYTHARRPVQLVYTKKFRTKSAALKTEFKIKQLTREEKILLIARATAC
ncbi:MAG: hypothetical protein A3C15_02835 [Candidatus Magasanikbacteria bacterium RIFCSPHIGHO2_02_FULL_50_9b]|uniref:GIY-YIG domain-containing protein n=1 Tax=Candidatus Magasanikbacteria bacterium RIFCSPHIGHO2_02_FULL_50_9b TaxID=1798682 RepID=A0A1F6M8B3_9BACT|nr:MAG: hypothetical protein A3C15_02835 [Candidatus Magasanikbacteria bacterium RIFCSPHIGHO2_02_FULL_50_9b]